MDSSGSGQRPVAGSCGHSNEHSDSKNNEEFIDQLSNYQLVKKGALFHGIL
jgi:hypothetical protein